MLSIATKQHNYRLSILNYQLNFVPLQKNKFFSPFFIQYCLKGQ